MVPRRRISTKFGSGDRCKGRRFAARRMYVPGILSSQPSQVCLPSHGTVPERRANVQKGARLTGTRPKVFGAVTRLGWPSSLMPGGRLTKWSCVFCVARRYLTRRRRSFRFSRDTRVGFPKARSLVPQQVSQHVRADTRRRRVRHDSPLQIVQPNVCQPRQPRHRREVGARSPIRQWSARVDREHVVIPIQPRPGAHDRKRRVRKVMHPAPGLRLRQRHAPTLEVDMLPANRAHFRYSQSGQRRNPDRGDARGVPVVEPVKSGRQRWARSCRPRSTGSRPPVCRQPSPRTIARSATLWEGHALAA